MTTGNDASKRGGQNHQGGRFLSEKGGGETGDGQLQLLEVVAEREFDGARMGVFENGQAYMSVRAIARMCGKDHTSILHHVHGWRDGKRNTPFLRTLVQRGYDRDVLHVGSGVRHGEFLIPEEVCQAFVTFYAFGDNPTPQAKESAARLMQAGVRAFVYSVVGYAPGPDPRQKYFDRQECNTVPDGYFSVFKEMDELILSLIRQGFPVDDQTVPDISVGRIWSEYWEGRDLGAKFPARIQYQHNYPPYFPQAASNPQQSWAYPDEALAVFRRWLRDEYVPSAFPAYVGRKIDKKQIAPMMGQRLVEAATSRRLLGAPSRKAS